MKRSVLYLFLFIIGLIGFGSCSDDSLDVDSVNKQTILVFMPWSGAGLHPYLLRNLDSIESAITTAKGLDGRLLVMLATSASQASLYEVTYNNGQIQHTTIKEYNDNSYYTVEGMTQLFNDVKTNAEALNYALMIGGHGMGWLYKSDWTTSYDAKSFTGNSKHGADKGIVDNMMPSFTQTRFFGNTTDVSNAFDIADLAAAIQGAGMKMQYILFDDCYMANVETAYELKDATNFLIGSTCEIMSEGMPYKTMWSSLATATPNYTTAANNFLTFYSNYSIDGYSYPYGALSVIDCRNLDGLAKLMRGINGRYTFADSLRDSLQVLDGFHTPIFYDLGDYVAHLCKNNDMLNDFNSTLSSVIKTSVHTDEVYTLLYYPYESGRTFKLNRYSGITISDPSQNSMAVKGKEKTAWWKATHTSANN